MNSRRGWARRPRFGNPDRRDAFTVVGCPQLLRGFIAAPAVLILRASDICPRPPAPTAGAWAVVGQRPIPAARALSGVVCGLTIPARCQPLVPRPQPRERIGRLYTVVRVGLSPLFVVSVLVRDYEQF